MKKRIGIFGGSFNPIHYGHLNVGVEIAEKTPLDEVWFVPAKISPHKTEQTILSLEHRLAMLNLAFERFPLFKAMDIEGNRAPPSYTIDTVKHLIHFYPKHQFYLIVGSDAISKFLMWKDVEELVRIIPILIATRNHSSDFLEPIVDFPEIYSILKNGVVEIRRMEISSTIIRNRLANKKVCDHLVPVKVVDYINEYRLY